MPGRKSNVSTVSQGPEEAQEAPPSAKASKDRDGFGVEDLSLPKSMIARLAKGVLPPNTQIHKDALLALHKSATVFVSYIASNANENAMGSGKKTIAPHDVIAALKDSELEAFLPRLEAELRKYNEVQCDKRNTYRKKIKDEKAAAAAKEDLDDGKNDATLEGQLPQPDVSHGELDGLALDEDVDRPMKKMKGMDGESFIVDQGDADEEDDAGDEDESHELDDDAFEDAIDDEVEDEADGQDETVDEDVLEEGESRMEVVDEALDDQDSD